MPVPREQIQSMAFMAMMDGIGIGSLSCSCPTCKGDRKSRNGSRPPSRRDTPESAAVKSSNKQDAATGHCHHTSHGSHTAPSPRSSSATAKKISTPSSPPSKPATNSLNTPPSTSQGRETKVNSLLKACSDKAVFEIFNQTMATTDERELAQQIQNATKDSKLYSEVKEKVFEICDDDDIDLGAVFGLLAKFRHERNLLTTAILKSNAEREKSHTERDKALLCIKRVDDLMYMLQDVAKRPKEADGDTFMHKLGDIIVEIHDLAKSPSALYDELLDIREDHFQLVDDHEEMHQKFVDVNSCHDKLHSSHDKLQQSHNKLKEEFSEAKKKAGLVGGLKSDVARMEKAADKGRDENANLKKEVERLNAELTKVNSLKHENAQLKKKITTLSSSQANSAAPTTSVDSPATAQLNSSQGAKKKKGKKNSTVTSSTPEETQVPEQPIESTTTKMVPKEDLLKLKESHGLLVKELELLREKLRQLEALRVGAEESRDQAIEKLQVERAKSESWHDIAQTRAGEKEHLHAKLDHSQSMVSKLQAAVKILEKDLIQVGDEMARHKDAHAKLECEVKNEPEKEVITVSGPPVSIIGPDVVRLLQKMKSDVSQLVGNLDEARSYGGDLHVLLNIIQIEVRKVMADIEGNIDEILHTKRVDGPSQQVPETVLPFSYNDGHPVRHTSSHHQALVSRPSYSPQESPRLALASDVTPSNSSFTSYRPLVPPGFGEPSPVPSSLHGYSRGSELNPGSRVFTPSSTSSFLHSSPGPVHPSGPSASHAPGAIGPRSASGGATTTLSRNKATDTSSHTTLSPIGTPAPSTTSGTGGLGNGASGVDWSMWSKPVK